MKTAPKQPEHTCSSCSKRTRQECSQVACPNRKPQTAGLHLPAYTTNGDGCYVRRSRPPKD